MQSLQLASSCGQWRYSRLTTDIGGALLALWNFLAVYQLLNESYEWERKIQYKAQYVNAMQVQLRRS